MVFINLYSKLNNIIQKLGKRRVSVIAGATTVAVFITSYAVFINPTLDGLTGYAIQLPAEEEMLKYGQAIQIKSDYFNNFLSGKGESGSSSTTMMPNALGNEQWIIMSAENKTDKVKFGDKVYFKSVTFNNHYLSSRSTNSRAEVASAPNTWEVWRIVNTFDTSSEDEVCILDPIFIKSVNFGNYLSADGYDPSSKAWLASAPSSWEKWEIQPYQYYKNWMSFSTKIHEKPLREITFPAAHDAGAKDFIDVLSTCTDTKKYKNYLDDLDNISSLANKSISIGGVSLRPTSFPNISGFNTIISNAMSTFYSKTEGLSKATDFSVGQQLDRGVRWFDLRVDLRMDSPGQVTAYIHHALVSQKMDKILNEIKSYLDSTKGEIIVLELTHFADDFYMGNKDIAALDYKFEDGYNQFMKSVLNMLGDYIYSCDESINPMNLKYNQVITNNKSKVILLVGDEPEGITDDYNPQKTDFLFTYGELGMQNQGGDYNYSGKTSLKEMVANQQVKFDQAKSKNDIYTVWYTLTGSSDEYLAIVANAAIRGAVSDLAANITPYIITWIPGARDKVKEFLEDSILSKFSDELKIDDDPDFSTLRELSERVGGHARETFEKNFQSLYNPYGHNDITVLYFDAFYYNTDCVDVAIAYSRLPEKGKEAKSDYDPAADIQDDELYYIRNKATGLYLDVNGGTDADGTKVHQYHSNGTKAQQWRVKYNEGNGLYSIESTAAPDRVLDVYSNDEKLDGRIDVWTDRGAPGMLYALSPTDDTTDGATYKLLTGCSNFKLAVVGQNSKTDGATVTQVNPKNDHSDEWEFIKVQVPPPDPKYTEQTAIQSGGIYYIQNVQTKKYLDVDANNDANGAKVQQWEYTGGNNQKWQINYLGDGLYEFVPYYGSSSRVVDVFVPDDTECGKVDIWRKNLTSSTRFALKPTLFSDGDYKKNMTAYQIFSQCSNFTKAITVLSDSNYINNGQPIQQKTPTQSGYGCIRYWYFIPVPGFQPTYTDPVEIKDGGLYNIAVWVNVSRNTSKEIWKWKYLYVNGGKDEAGSEADLEDQNYASDQIWQAVSVGNGLYEFHPFGGSSNTLTVTTANNLEYKTRLILPILPPLEYMCYTNLLHINPDTDLPSQRFALASVPGEKNFYLLPQCADFKQAVVPYGLSNSFILTGGEWTKTAMANLSGNEQYATFKLEPVR